MSENTSDYYIQGSDVKGNQELANLVPVYCMPKFTNKSWYTSRSMTWLVTFNISLVTARQFY